MTPKYEDITLNKRSYRGNTSYIVCWKESGFPDQKDFTSEQEAAAFIRQMKLKDQAQQQAAAKAAAPKAEVAAEPWIEPMKAYLKLLNVTPVELNAFLANLTKTTKRSFKDWVEYVNQSVSTRAAVNVLATNQNCTVDEYLSKLNDFEEEPLDEVLDAYHRYNFSRIETRRLLDEYISECQSNDEDEDEVQFAKIKLERMLSSFKFDIFSVDDIQVEAWLNDQKGSAGAKRRLADIIQSFREFATKHGTDAPRAYNSAIA